MSMSRGCLVIELERNEWYCVIANQECDYDFAGDHAVYGPEPGPEAAFRAAMRYTSNPGECQTVELDEVEGRHIALIRRGYRPQPPR